METWQAIRTRRSTRKFKYRDVPADLINKVLIAGTRAPYGRNQLWRFAVIKDRRLKSKIAEQTLYREILENAPVIILVFFDKNDLYDEIKDAQTMGACIQNMLLLIHSLGLAGVWIGEIRKNREEVRKLCNAPQNFELSAVIAIGYGDETGVDDEKRKSLDKIVFLRK